MRQQILAVVFSEQARLVGLGDEELFECISVGGVGNTVRILDIVVDAHAAVTAPAGAVERVVRVDVRAEAHDHLAGGSHK